MKKIYSSRFAIIIMLAAAVSLTASCKKDKKNPTPTVTAPTPIKLGLYTYGDVSSGLKLFYLAVSHIGNQGTSQTLIFDTGSAGMSIDAQGILPDSTFNDAGFTFTGDSLVYNGITVTNQKGVMEYGDNTDLTIVSGVLAYADVTFGDQAGAEASVKRLPFFLYYKAEQYDNNVKQATYPHHYFDIAGVGPTYSYATNSILSPLSYVDPGTGLTKGYKIAAVPSSKFGAALTLIPGAVTIGLTQADLTSNGFVMHNLSPSATEYYSPNIPSTIAYNGKTIAGQVVFDTGTSPYNYIEDKTAVVNHVGLMPTGVQAKIAAAAKQQISSGSGSSLLTKSISAVGALQTGSTVTITTNEGFVYTFTTTNSDYLTQIENPSQTGDTRTILSIEYFLTNEYLLDYADHKIGLKNN